MLLGLVSILLLVAAAAFFVASEYSLVSVRKTRIEQLVGEGNAVAADVKRALEHLDRYIAAVQVGITIVTLILGALGEPVLAEVIRPLLEPVTSPFTQVVTAYGLAVGISFLIVTVLEIVLGEIVPKIIARQRSEAVVLLLIRPLNLFVFVFRPLIWMVTALSNAVLKLVGVHPGNEHGSVYSVEELEMLVVSSRQAGVLDKEEEVILRRVFDFGDLTARQVMRPRTEVTAISVTDTLSEVIATIERHTHTRFPVYEGDLDNIVGVLHVKDIFTLLAQVHTASVGDGHEHSGGGASTYPSGFSVLDLMRPIQAVPETLDVAELLRRMQQGGHQIAVVIDEYGGTAGIVTLEDIVEEIVGEVRDEFDQEGGNPDIVVTPEGTLVDGLLSIDDANEALGLQMEGVADTVGGYVFERLGRKPELGDEITVNDNIMRVEDLDGLRIAKVRIVPRRNGSVTPDEE